MKWFYTTFSLLLLGLCLYFASLIVIPLVGGLVMTFMLYPFLHAFEQRGFARSSSVLIVMSTSLLILIIASWLILPVFAEQIESMLDRKEVIYASTEHWIQSINTWIGHHWGSSKRDEIDAILLNKGQIILKNLGEEIPQLALGLLSLLGNLLLAPIVAFFLLLEGGEIYRKVLSFVPQKSFELVARILQKSAQLVGAYLRGQALDCAIVALLLWIGLAIIGVKGALAIGILSGLLNAIPYVGPIIGLCLCYLSFFADPAATYTWWSIAVIFIAVMKIDGYVIYPQTVGRSLKLNTFVVMLSLMAGGAYAGILGMLIATPLVALSLETLFVFRNTWLGLEIEN